MHQYELTHHGVKGMKWGVRRYQNKDGSLTAAGKNRSAKIKEERAKAIERDAELQKKMKAAKDERNEFFDSLDPKKDYYNNGYRRDLTKARIKQLNAIDEKIKSIQDEIWDNDALIKQRTVGEKALESLKDMGVFAASVAAVTATFYVANKIKS